MDQCVYPKKSFAKGDFDRYSWKKTYVFIAGNFTEANIISTVAVLNLFNRICFVLKKTPAKRVTRRSIEFLTDFSLRTRKSIYHTNRLRHNRITDPFFCPNWKIQDFQEGQENTISEGLTVRELFHRLSTARLLYRKYAANLLTIKLFSGPFDRQSNVIQVKMRDSFSTREEKRTEPVPT